MNFCVQAYSSETGQTITTIYSGLFEERSNGDRLYHIKSPAGISALVVTYKNNSAKRDIPRKVEELGGMRDK